MQKLHVERKHVKCCSQGIDWTRAWWASKLTKFGGLTSFRDSQRQHAGQ